MNASQPPSLGMADDAMDSLRYYYTNERFHLFFDFYNNHMHRSLSLCVCTFGCVANVLNIAVLTRRHMRQSATNVLLTGLSSAQLGLVVVYMFQLVCDVLVASCVRQMYDYLWMLMRLVCINLTIIFHTVAICHTVSLALIRYCAVCKATKPNAQRMTTAGAARRLTAALYFSVPVICLPVYFSTRIATFEQNENWDHPCNFTADARPIYDIDFGAEVLLKISLWMFGAVFKLGPCVTICVCSGYLVLSLHKVQRRKSLLLFNQRLSRKKARVRTHHRTTRLLVAVMLLFVAVELPHGVLCFLVGVLDQAFAYEVYNNTGEFVNMLTLLYSSINFILYCTMNSQFMITFRNMFMPCCCAGSKSVDSSLHAVVKDQVTILHGATYSPLRSSNNCLDASNPNANGSTHDDNKTPV